MTDGSRAASCEESTVWRRRWTSGSLDDSCERLLPPGQESSSASRSVLPGYPGDELQRWSLTADTRASPCLTESQLRSLYSQMNPNKNVRLFFFFLSTESKKKKRCITEEKKCPKLQAPRGLSSQSSLLWRVVHSLLPGQHWLRLMKLGIRPGGLWHLDGEPVPLSLCFPICSSSLCFSPKSHLYLFNCTCPFAPSCPVL